MKGRVRMSSQYTLKITGEQAKEMPMVDLAFEVLKAANTPFYYRDLMQEIAKIKRLSENEAMQVIAQLYTEINIDGRFACVGNNLWGLKRWYPVDKSEDAVGGGKYPRIINDEDDDLDEEEDFDARDGDEFDDYEGADDADEFIEEEEEEEDFPEDEFDEELDSELEEEEVDVEDEAEDEDDLFEDEEDEEIDK